MFRLKRVSARGAFALIELLAVVAIIAILVAVLIPVAGNVRNNSWRAQCASNMRQIGAGLFLYAEDHGQSLPAMASQAQPSSGDNTWARAIWTYVGYVEDAYSSPENDFIGMRGEDRNIFHCPSTKSNPIAAPSVSAGVNPNRTSYGLNVFPLIGTEIGWTSGYKTSPIPLSIIKTPSSTAMVNECSFFLGGWEGYYQYFGLVPHNGGSNILFYDGHIEWKNFEDIPSGYGNSFWK